MNSRVRIVLVVAGITVAVLGVGRALLSGLSQLDVAGDPVYTDPERVPSSEPPPDFGPPATDEERIAHWLLKLTTGEPEDAEWGLRQIEIAGAPARKELLAAAHRSLRSNPALVERAMDYFVSRPADDALPLAREALDNRDPQVVVRAAAVLAGVGGARARESVHALASAARDREHPIPFAVMDALWRIGGEEAFDAIDGVVESLGLAQSAYAYAAMARFPPEIGRGRLRARFHAEEDPHLKLAAAEGLVRQGNGSSVEWLREELGRRAVGSYRRNAVLAILAYARDDRALAEIRDRLASPLNPERIETLIGLLARYPPERKEQLLREVAGPGNHVDVRVAALEALVLAEIPGMLDAVVKLLRVPGVDGADDRKVAALVLGRVRRPETSGALVNSLVAGRKRRDDAYGLALRAVVLVGDPAGAAVVAKAMADDRGEYGAGGDAFNIVTALDKASPAFEAALGEVLIQEVRTRGDELTGSGFMHILIAVRMVCTADSEAPALVEKYLLHEDSNVSQGAAQILAEIGGKRNRAALVHAWRQPLDEFTRALVRDVLERIHYQATGPMR